MEELLEGFGSGGEVEGGLGELCFEEVDASSEEELERGSSRLSERGRGRTDDGLGR